jgi:dihydroorotase-like cyclic amidohydrolase
MDADRLRSIYQTWPKEKPVLLHAEEDVIETAMQSLEGLDRHVHICHVSSRIVLEQVMKMKAADYPVTCGVCPHHLFLTRDDAKRLGPYGVMKPSLKTKADQDFLETTLPLLLQAAREGKITREQIIDKLHTTPARLFNLHSESDTYIEIEETAFKITNDQLQTKCNWSPYAGMPGYGKVTRTVIRGVTRYENGEVTAAAGSGRLLPKAS